MANNTLYDMADNISHYSIFILDYNLIVELSKHVLIVSQHCIKGCEFHMPLNHCFNVALRHQIIVSFKHLAQKGPT